MLSGTRSGLRDPSSILLSASTAKALFGDADPLNRMMRIDNQMDVKVTGVYKDLPHNTEFSSMKFLSSWDLLLSHNKWMMDGTDWGNSSFLIYVQLQPNAGFAEVSERIKNATYDNAVIDKKFNIRTFLNPMSRWHLYSDWKEDINVGGRIQIVWLFCIIGVFVLLLACINFINLSTARSEKRAKEVGIRKAVGSMRAELIVQFLAESFVVVSLAFFIALVLVTISLPWFNALADKQITMFWSKPFFWALSLAFIVITSAIAGSYPAFYLSSFNPVTALKGTYRAGRFAALPRKALVVVQFTVSIILIMGTVIVYRQIQFAKNRPVGYDRGGLLMVQIKSADLRDKLNVLNNELKVKGIAADVGCSSGPVTGVWSKSSAFEWKDKDPNKTESFAINWTTFDYGKTVGWKIKEGRDFSTAFVTDSVSSHSKPGLVYHLLINEAAVKYMQLKNPVGEIIKWDNQPFRIIGVVKDMIMESPFEAVRPAIFGINYEEATAYINIRISPALSAAEAISKTEAVFKKLVPSVPFDYQFADTEFSQKFSNEERIGKLAAVFSTLAIFISCLGLFGLAAFMAERRTKEIGVRKVQGATVYSLWKLLSADFVRLVILACLIAVPLANHLLQKWLQKYDYHTEINWWIFAIVIAGALLITLCTVSYQAIKAATKNPIKSLRTE
ncbi:ABC transporter permease [Flavitalea sp.]|nr:FtsX-like permease family protein [Flavitalea sp.]